MFGRAVERGFWERYGSLVGGGGGGIPGQKWLFKAKRGEVRTSAYLTISWLIFELLLVTLSRRPKSP